MPCCNTELHKQKNFDKCKGLEINYTNYLIPDDFSNKVSEGEFEVTIKPKKLKEGIIIDGKQVHRGDSVMIVKQVADYNDAVTCGATYLRIGSLIFGNRS